MMDVDNPQPASILCTHCDINGRGDTASRKRDKNNVALLLAASLHASLLSPARSTGHMVALMGAFLSSDFFCSLVCPCSPPRISGTARRRRSCGEASRD